MENSLETFKRMWFKDPILACSQYLTNCNIAHHLVEKNIISGTKKDIHFKDKNNFLWVIETNNNNFKDYPRLYITKYSEDEPMFTLMDKIEIIDDVDSLNLCTADECILLAYNLIADVKSIIAHELTYSPP